MTPEDLAPHLHRLTLPTDSDADDSYDIVGYESAQPTLAQVALPFCADLASD